MHTREQHFQRYITAHPTSDKHNYSSTVHACSDTVVGTPIHLQQTHSYFLTTPHPYATTSQCHRTLSPPFPVTPPLPMPLPSGQPEPVGSSVTLSDVTVTLMDQQDLADMVIRTFHLSQVSCPAVPCPPTTDTWLLVMWRERLSGRSLLQSLEGVCVHLVEWTDLLLVCSSSVKTEVVSDV